MGMLSVIKNVPKTIIRVSGKTMFALKKAKPQILVGAGVAIATGSFIIAIINARKIDNVIEEGDAKVSELEARKAQAQSEGADSIALKEFDRNIRKAKQKNIMKMFWLLGMPILGFAGGITMVIGGHIIVVKRFGELSSAFAALQQTFDRYRQMNIAEHGEECDRRYRYGIVGDTDVKATITDDNGKEKEVKCKVPVVDKSQAASMYEFVFSEDFSRRCPKDPVNTISFLRSQEKYWNTWMESKRKPVTLYMVLEELGIELDPDDPMNDYIMIAGWRPNGDGDNHIDFGIMRAVNQPVLRMEENVVFLNFNCDGNLWHSPRYTKEGKKVC